MRTESADDVWAFARQVRLVAETLESLYGDAQQLSDPLFMTGWTRPLGMVGGLPKDLRRWAEVLEAEAGKPETSAT